MRYDVVMVTYNKKERLQECVKALAAVNEPLDALHLIVVDNGSTDDTAACLNQLRETYTGFGGFTVLHKCDAAACNQGAAKGNAPLVFFLNVNTEVDPAVFTALDAAIAQAPASVGAFECCQRPYEASHHIDPVTLETAWASGTAWVVRRPVWEETGGFDEHITLYGEDRDLSWRIRAKGYAIRYVPRAKVVCHTENQTDNLAGYAGRLYGELLLRYKFGSGKEIWQGEKQYWDALRHPQHFDGVRRVLAKNYLRHWAKLWPFWGWRFAHRAEFQARTAQ